MRATRKRGRKGGLNIQRGGAPVFYRIVGKCKNDGVYEPTESFEIDNYDYDLRYVVGQTIFTNQLSGKGLGSGVLVENANFHEPSMMIMRLPNGRIIEVFTIFTSSPIRLGPDRFQYGIQTYHIRIAEYKLELSDGTKMTLNEDQARRTHFEPF